MRNFSFPIHDVYDLWEAQDIANERKLARLPQCEYCGEHIQDEFYFEINGEYLCEDCLNEQFRKENTFLEDE